MYSVATIVVTQEQIVTLALYQGLNLEQDEVVSTPEVISVVFCGARTEPFVPVLDRDLLAFPPEVDLFLPYHPQSDQTLWLAPGDGAQVMLLVLSLPPVEQYDMPTHRRRSRSTRWI